MNALTAIAGDIRVEHEAARRSASEAIAHAIRAGELLLEAKAGMPHGAFGAWLSASIEFSERTAQAYMRLARLDEEKRNALRKLPLRQALAEIATPRAPAELSTRVSREALSKLPTEELNRLRFAHLTEFVEITEGILADDDFDKLTPTARNHALRAIKDCDERLTDLAARSPNGKHLYLAMYGKHQCTAIVAALQRRTP